MPNPLGVFPGDIWLLVAEDVSSASCFPHVSMVVGFILSEMTILWRLVCPSMSSAGLMLQLMIEKQENQPYSNMLYTDQ